MGSYDWNLFIITSFITRKLYFCCKTHSFQNVIGGFPSLMGGYDCDGWSFSFWHVSRRLIVVIVCYLCNLISLFSLLYLVVSVPRKSWRIICRGPYTHLLKHTLLSRLENALRDQWRELQVSHFKNIYCACICFGVERVWRQIGDKIDHCISCRRNFLIPWKIALRVVVFHSSCSSFRRNLA